MTSSFHCVYVTDRECRKLIPCKQMKVCRWHTILRNDYKANDHGIDPWSTCLIASKIRFDKNGLDLKLDKNALIQMLTAHRTKELSPVTQITVAELAIQLKSAAAAGSHFGHCFQLQCTNQEWLWGVILSYLHPVQFSCRNLRNG